MEGEHRLDSPHRDDHVRLRVHQIWSATRAASPTAHRGAEFRGRCLLRDSGGWRLRCVSEQDRPGQGRTANHSLRDQIVMDGNLSPPTTTLLRNGPGAAAVLSAAIGSLAFGIFAFAADAVPAIGRGFVFWTPTGALSGVSSTAIVVWLITWYVLSRRLASRDVNLVWVNVASGLMLIAALLLTFPPFMDWLQDL